MRTKRLKMALAMMMAAVLLQSQTTPSAELADKATLEMSRKGQEWDNKTAVDQRQKAFWSNALDANKSLAGYADYFAKKYTSPAPESKTAVNQMNCTDPCFDHGWRYLGPENVTPNIQVNGRVDCIWVNPSNDNHIRIGAKGGLWETQNNGTTWVNLTDVGISGIGVYWVESPVSAPNTIYIATGVAALGATYNTGIFKSINGGASWTHLNVVPAAQFADAFSNKIVVHPSNPNVVYALAGPEIYKSINAGASWTMIFGTTSNPAKLLLKDLEIVPNGSVDELYISSQTREPFCYGTNNCATICSSPHPTFIANTGSTYCDMRYTAQVWRVQILQSAVVPSSSSNLVGLLPGYPKNTTAALISIAGTTVNICAYTETSVPALPGYSTNVDAVVYRKSSTVPFTQLFTVPVGAGLNPAGCTFDVSPSNNNIIYFGGLTLIKKVGTLNPQGMYSYTGYQSDANLPHPDIRCLKVYSTNQSGSADKLFFGNDGGVSKTTNGGITYLNLNGAGLQLTDVWGISNSEKYPNYIACGVQDFGAFFNRQHGWSWSYLGDAYDAASSDANPFETVVASTGYKLSRHTGTSNTITPISASLMTMQLPHELCGIGNDVLYFGSEKTPQGLYQYNFNTGAVSPLVTSFPGAAAEITGLAATKNNSKVWVGFNTIGYGTMSQIGLLYSVTNPGSTSPIVQDWSAGSRGNQWAGITDLAIEPVNGDKVWCSFNGICCPNFKVMLFNRLGPGNLPTWTEYGQGLPNVPATSIVYLEGSNDLLFLGTADGVYYRDASMSQWAKFSCGLPGVPVTDLEINYRLRQLRAGTFGRGIWSTQIPVN